MSRGAIYLASGAEYIAEAEASAAHLARFGLEHRIFEPEGLSDDAHGAKAGMYGVTPYACTVYLDTDTRVLGDLSFGFEMAERHGLAIAIAPACYARRHDPGLGDAIEYNTGVIFFRRSPEVAELFEAWAAIAHTHKRDQATFARAVVETGFNPFVLPRNWNYRAGIDSPQVYGPIKVWHSRAVLDDRSAGVLASLPTRFTTIAVRTPGG